MAEQILVSTEGFIAIVTLNIPQKLNALTGELVFQLASILEDIAGRPEIYVTLITGNGRLFSAGADLGSLGKSPEGREETRKYWLETLTSHNIRNCRAFYKHPKILITALNGPVIGYTACLIAFSDFIYAVDDAYLSTPFVNLGLVAEGVSSFAFVQRMGIAKANQCLISGKRIPAQDLYNCGFVDVVLPKTLDPAEFKARVLEQVNKDISVDADRDAMLQIKSLIRRPYMRVLDEQNVYEAFAGMDRFIQGLPQQQFRKSGARKTRGNL